MPRVIHFEIGADDPERATAFYQKVFGWNISKWEGPQDYWLVTTGDSSQPGIDGAIMRRGFPQPVVNTIDVASLEDVVAKIEANGGTILERRMVIPGIGYLAYFQDTEGNAFGAMQNDPSAA